LRPRRDDELSRCIAGFHFRVGLDDLVEAVRAVDRDDGGPGGDSVQEPLQDSGGEVSRVSAVGRQSHAARDVVDRVEVLHGPLVRQHSGEAHHSVNSNGAERVGQGGRTDQLQGSVGAVRKNPPHLLGDLSVVDEDVVDPKFGECRELARAAGGGEHRHFALFGQDGRCHSDR
jgi:hypothetical protein